ncbi:hypothetical protein LEP1GSC074_0970 [Leptospira noguchii str. Hook]|uniref:Uncharacterized protein n=2 Tax=Leptospira noguchii TaxID=28182 RepID=M6UDN0_9LEPT|nr:hypothetical protein LEP1GSC035_0039 [Leptospira noguchii str. 2007001578]EMO42670.1 hypothetical protein LEP1GSC186_0793 [Leptospira noguchii serovar Autumnalis str. ZUN142]EMS87225.1 hypothetical protein LEP1GSC073_3813 [Leptospira noguchii str. Cascata]EMS88811.1 hypothetical protein LEP1GSC074_0970 [Leptospira noguchii str. Hook]
METTTLYGYLKNPNYEFTKRHRILHTNLLKSDTNKFKFTF